MAGRIDAERRMQAVNAAWTVLGDREARAAYDAELVRTGQIPAPEDPIVEAEVWRAGPATTLRRLAPLIVLLVVLAAIFLFTAYAGGPGS